MTTRSLARRRFVVECTATAGVAVLWLGSLVREVGGEQTAAAISNFGLIAAAAEHTLALMLAAARHIPDRKSVV